MCSDVPRRLPTACARSFILVSPAIFSLGGFIATILVFFVPIRSTVATTAMVFPVSSQPRVAVIGAGAAGLAAARVISRDTGLNPIVLEQDVDGGGVWRYQPKGAPSSSSESDRTNHRPMYAGLRTNLPKELMAFREYPFPIDEDDDDTQASFVTHAQVQGYLLKYRQHFKLNHFIQYGSTVQHLKILPETTSKLSPVSEAWPQIQLKWTTTHGDPIGVARQEEDIFDAVLVCNGHYAAPSYPHIPGLDQYFQGKVMHSIDYDTPEQFEDQVVLCIGGRASGADLAREISQHARRVFLSDTTCQQLENKGKVTWVPRTILVDSDGTIIFAHDCPIQPNNVNTIIFCSGYDYQFPFINAESSNLEFSAPPGERRVQPLVYQLWHATHPSVAFVGLPHSVVPFPLFELQVEAVVAQWTKEYKLPSLEERIILAERDASSGGPLRPRTKGRVQDTHFLGDLQWDYCRQLVQLAQLNDDEHVQEYLRTNQEIYDHAGAARKSEFPGGPDHYRSIRYSRTNWREWKVLADTSITGTKDDTSQFNDYSRIH